MSNDQENRAGNFNPQNSQEGDEPDIPIVTLEPKIFSEIEQERDNKPMFDLVVSRNVPNWIKNLEDDTDSNWLIVNSDKVRNSGVDLYDSELLSDTFSDKYYIGSDGKVFDYPPDESTKYILMKLPQQTKIENGSNQDTPEELEECEAGFQEENMEKMIEHSKTLDMLGIYNYASAPDWPKGIPDHGGDEDNMLVVNLTKVSDEAREPIELLVDNFDSLGGSWDDIIVFYDNGKIFEYENARSAFQHMEEVDGEKPLFCV